MPVDIDVTRWPPADKWIEIIASEIDADADIPAMPPAARQRLRAVIGRAMGRVADWRMELKILRILNKMVLKLMAKDPGYQTYDEVRDKFMAAFDNAVLENYDEEGNYIGG